MYVQALCFVLRIWKGKTVSAFKSSRSTPNETKNVNSHYRTTLKSFGL